MGDRKLVLIEWRDSYGGTTGWKELGDWAIYSCVGGVSFAQD